MSVLALEKRISDLQEQLKVAKKKERIELEKVRDESFIEFTKNILETINGDWRDVDLVKLFNFIYDEISNVPVNAIQIEENSLQEYKKLTKELRDRRLGNKRKRDNVIDSIDERDY